MTRWKIDFPDEDPQVVVNDLYSIAEYEGVELEAWTAYEDRVIVESSDPLYRVQHVLDQTGEEYVRQTD